MSLVAQYTYKQSIRQKRQFTLFKWIYLSRAFGLSFFVSLKLEKHNVYPQTCKWGYNVVFSQCLSGGLSKGKVTRKCYFLPALNKNVFLQYYISAKLYISFSQVHLKISNRICCKVVKSNRLGTEFQTIPCHSIMFRGAHREILVNEGLLKTRWIV